MKRTALLLVLMLIVCMVPAQNTTTLQEAFLDENGRPAIREKTVSFSEEQSVPEELTPQAPGWPKTFKRNTNYFPNRGLALADLNNDGKDEIIFSANKILYAYEGDGRLLWQRQLLKDSDWPPAVADVTGNGNLEVVIIAHDSYFSTVGHVYVVDNTGQILPGWPVNIGVSLIPASPTLADLDNNGQMEIIFGSQNMVHILKANGAPFSSNWPVQLDGNSAFTVSAGDINNDGQLNIIAGSVNGTLYAFNLQGQTLPGYPVSKPNTEFYWNSPMLVDFDNTGELCIVGALAGGAHEIYARDHNGEYRNGWPRTTHPQGPNYDNSEWTATQYAVPAIADINSDGNREVFCWGDVFAPMGSGLYNVYGLTRNGNDLPNFPFNTNGNHGFTSVADLDGDGQFELIHPGPTADGNPWMGFIYAFKADGSQLPGFPLRPKGWLLYSGVNLGDVTGDGMLNLVALGAIGLYSGQDSTAINVFNTNIPIADANIQFGTYKGSNTRTGLFEASPFKDVAPGAVANFNVTPAAQGVLQATITWNNPALQVNGSPLTELNQVKIFRDSIEIATINNPVIGAELTFMDNTIQENGSYNYRIFGVNNAGRGVNSYAQCYIGQDVPAAPGNVLLTTNLSNATISWVAPSAGLNGGYFTGDNITYTVTRIIRTGFYGLPDEHVVAENITGLQVAENEVETGRWSYRVIASNNIGEGGSATSNFELLAPDSILMFEAFNYDHWKLPPGWDFVGDHELAWQVSPFKMAGGLAPELRIIHRPINIGVSWMKTYPVDITGASLLKLNFKQSLSNRDLDQGEIIGLDVTYDDGLNWDVIWEMAIGTASIPVAEYEFYFYVPDGATSLKLGFRFQGNNDNMWSWEIDDVIITDVSYLRVVNFIIVEDSDEELPVAGAKVVIDSIEYFADENGHVLVYLPTGTTNTAVVSANGYVGQTLEIIVGEENQTVVVKLMDVLTAPYDLHVTTEGLEDGQALLGWNSYGSNYEFRHDDGTVTTQLGSPSGTLNTVLGSAYRYDAILEEMSWFITDESGPHNSVKIWVFGLNSSGIPNPSNILFQQVVSNIDMRWNTYRFAVPIEAPNGFYLGISYAGFAALAMDTGADPQWPFQPNTHFVASYYLSGFTAIDALGISKNFLIRAVGTNNGALRLEMNTETHPVIHDVEFSSVKPDKPFEAGNPQYTGFNRTFAGFNVYLNDLTTPVAENVSETHYLFTGLGTGSHVAGVQSVYTTGVSEIVTTQFEVVNGVVNTDANILSFAFNAAENPSLPADIVGTINPATFSITLDVLENIDVSSLIATFTLSNLASASIGGVIQESGVTANNFTNPVVYTVTAEAGNTQDWTVTVNTLPCLSPWNYLVTSSIHTINIPLATAPEVFGVPLAPLDWIGVFYLNDQGEEACGGAVQWTGTGNVAIIAYGDDPTTDEKDGFDAGEIFRWRLSLCGNPEDYTAIAAYDPGQPNQGSFASFGLSALTSLKAATIQYYAFNQGWNSISSYLNPIDPAVANMFSPIENNLTILSNLTSVYWPAQGVNTIGNWNSNSGYVAKVTANVDFMVGGADYVSGTFTIPAGWSYLPALSECPADVMDLFGGNLADVVIINELIGTGIFWPAYGINTIGNFQPGKAYAIKLVNPVTVTFPACDQKASTQLSTGINKISTIWGELDYSPEKQVTAFLKSALANLQTGDLLGAFNADGLLCGYLEVATVDHNLAITLFGNDQLSSNTNSLSNGEPVFFKLYRSQSGERFDMEVVYDPSMENSTGNYHTGTIAAITVLNLKSTGIDDMNTTYFSLVPNPATDVVTITTANGISQNVEILIYDMHGKMLIEDGFQQKTSMSIANLKPGVYMVVLRTALHTEVKKLLVN
jgi:hypothetical protein